MALDKNQLLKVTEEFGTPAFVYDGDEIRDQFRKFTGAFNVKDLKVHYACKALNNLHILKLIKEEGGGLDCVSIQEIRLGLLAGYNPSEIIFTPNNISHEEYDEAIELGVKINVDNLSMLEYIGMHHPGISVCVRINPHLMAGGNRKISVGHIDSKFGISIHQVPLLKRLVNRLNIHVEGIHVHTGSDIVDGEIFIRAAELIYSVVEQFEEVNYIDFGSGFKVKYHQDEINTDIVEFGKQFSESFNAFCQKMGRDYQLKFEPGKFLVSQSGYFLCKANLVKQTTACTFIGVDSGFNHFLRPMFYDAYHEIENLSRPNGKRKVYNVVGYICETDTFASDRIIPEVQEGDVLCFHNAGAYCFTMSSNYNSRPRPAEFLIDKGELKLIRRAENFEDLIRTQIPLE